MTHSLYSLQAETAEHVAGIRNLYSAVADESKVALIDLLRAQNAYAPAMSIVAVADKIVIGHILFAPIKLANRTGEKMRGAALTALAVLEPCQNMGIGSALVQAGLKYLTASDYVLALALGNQEYFTRFGFRAELGQKIQCAYSCAELLALELQPQILQPSTKITAIYPKAFAEASAGA